MPIQRRCSRWAAAIVVPQQSAFVVETLGRYSRTIQAGFHILVPFVERIAYKHNLKEEALDSEENDAGVYDVEH